MAAASRQEPEVKSRRTLPPVFLSGNGLENMTRRLAEIRGRCDIQSAPGQGTKVIFTVPLRIFTA